MVNIRCLTYDLKKDNLTHTKTQFCHVTFKKVKSELVEKNLYYTHTYEEKAAFSKSIQSERVI